jgi:hypothetical protein
MSQSARHVALRVVFFLGRIEPTPIAGVGTKKTGATNMTHQRLLNTAESLRRRLRAIGRPEAVYS